MTPGHLPRALRGAPTRIARAVPAVSLNLLLAAALAAALLVAQPEAGLSGDRGAADAAPAGGAVLLAPAADRAPVTPDVEQVPVPGTSAEGLTVDGATTDRDGRELAALSRTEQVEGFTVAGTTWRPGTAPDGMVVEIRTLDGGDWSAWEAVEVHDDHGPDPDSAEARGARDGSDAIVLGDVDEVQTRVTSPTGDAPDRLRLAVVDSDPVPADEATEPAAIEGELSNVASSTAAERPRIFSRAQWGANENLRSGSPSYAQVDGGFVHHTVSANGYTRDQVPGILRGIYAYHTQGRGWSDVGYNFLVDRFGRIWEGRHGGVSRAVVGAHTSGYNDDAFAMSAIGNFETARPTTAMLNAYGRLMAWKLGIHGVRADARVSLDGRSFKAISGHRDAGSTACPGAYLYARLGTVRAKAVDQQRPAVSTATVPHDFTGSRHADLLLRVPHRGTVKVRAGDGGPGFSRQRATSRLMPGSDLVLVSPDLTGDGNPDLVARPRPWRTRVWPGDGAGDFGRPRRGMTTFRSADLLVAVGDLDRDGHNDLVSRSDSNHAVYLHRGNGRGRFSAARRVLTRKGSWRWMAGVGDINGDRDPDLVALSADGRLRAHFGNGRGGLDRGRVIARGWGSKELVAGGVSLGMGRGSDLVVRERNGAVWLYVFDGDGRIIARTGNWGGMGNLDRLSAVPDVTGDGRADLVGRRGDGRVVVMAGNNRSWFARPRATGVSATGADLLLSAGDWTGDGENDALARSASNGRMQLWRGNGAGRLATRASWRGWGSFDQVVPVGDVTGDGVDDLMAQDHRRRMWVYPGTRRAATAPRFLARSSMIRSDLTVAAGQWDGRSGLDLIARSASSGDLYLYPGRLSGTLGTPRRIGRGYGGYDRVVGVGDITRDGQPDLVARAKADGHLWLLPGRPGGLRARQYVGSAPKLDLLG